MPTTIRIQADACIIYIWLAYEKGIIEIYADTHSHGTIIIIITILFLIYSDTHFLYILHMHFNFYELFYDSIANWLNCHCHTYKYMYANIRFFKRTIHLKKKKTNTNQHAYALFNRLTFQSIWYKVISIWILSIFSSSEYRSVGNLHSFQINSLK